MTISFRRSVAWLGVSQAANFVVLFGGSVILARLLSPYEMGVYAAAAAILGILGTLRSFGMPNIIIREPELTPTITSTAFTINAGLCALSAILLLIASAFAGPAMGNANIGRLLVLLAFLPAISIVEFLPAAYLERIGAFQQISVISLGKVVLTVAITVSLAFAGLSYMSLAWGNLAGALFSAICFNVAGRACASLRPSLGDWRRIGTFGLQMLTVNVLQAVVPRLFDLILGRIVGLAALGLWSRAYGLNQMLWDNVHTVVARVVFVDFSERQRRGMSLRDSYLRVSAILTGVLWPAFTGLAILSRPVVWTVYGPAWIDAATPLIMMSLAGVILTAVTMTWEVFVVRGENRAQIRYQLRRTALNVALFVASCFGGLNWAAASRVGDGMLAVVLARKDLQRMTGTRTSDFPPLFLRSAILTVAACLPSAVLMQAKSWSAATPFFEVLLSVAVGAVFWLVALRIQRHPLWEEIARVLDQAMARLRSRRAARAPAID